MCGQYLPSTQCTKYGVTGESAGHGSVHSKFARELSIKYTKVEKEFIFMCNITIIMWRFVVYVLQVAGVISQRLYMTTHGGYVHMSLLGQRLKGKEKEKYYF